MQRFVVLEKKIGETPLECLENWRTRIDLAQNTSLAYAGRLDPMASGKLLVLIGDECRHQEKYHGLDKEYEFEVLFGVQSDSGDVLGLIETCAHPVTTLDHKTKNSLEEACKKLTGKIELPYPHYSSKTVQGKPLHTWAIEGRLNEIEIPTKQSVIHSLKLIKLHAATKDEVFVYATHKIETIPPVTDPRRALGNDFRRPLVRESWKAFHDSRTTPDTFFIATFRCTASSGTYMRTLAEIIGKEIGTCGLAYSIHRTKIGHFKKLPFGFGFWRSIFK